MRLLGPSSLFGMSILGGVVGVASAALLGLFEGLRCGAATLPLAICLYVPLGAALGLAVGAVLGGLAEAGDGERPLLARLREDAAFDRALAAGLLAGAVCLAVEVLLVYRFARGPAAGMANPRLAALSTGLVAGAGLAAGVALFFPIWRLLVRLVAPLPRGRRLPLTLLLVGLGLVGLGGVASLVLGSLDWRVLRLGPWLMLGLLLVLCLGGCMVLGRRVAWRRPWVAFGLVVLLAVGLALGAPVAGRGAASVSAAQQDGLLLPLLIGVGRGLGDKDGDGYSAWFAGGDCDDGDAKVHPGARDVPGNGVDENCIGGDAVKRARRERPVDKPATGEPKQPAFDGNLLLLCIDTLRADMLDRKDEALGQLTPEINRLASRGARFLSAFAQGPNTPQSFPSIFTSLYPPRVPYRKKFTGYPPVGEQAQTVFELLRDKGFATAAVTSHFYFKPKRGITQGVEDWDNRDATNLRDSNKDIASPRIVPRALAKLKQLAAGTKRFALFVHLFEPHSTYVRHPQYKITKRGTAGLRQKYDYETKFVDDWVGKLLAGLAAAGLDKKTAVLLFSDHGEAFGEHKVYFHGQTLYNEVINIPLVLAVPGVVTEPRLVRRRVALIDIAPTILELFGLAAPESFQGYSLLPLARGKKGQAPPDREIGAVLMPYPAWPKGLQAVITGKHKVILHSTDNRLEVYDLEADPAEKKNLALGDPALAQRMRKKLATFVEQQLQ